MKRFWNIVLCVLSVVPLIAQEDYYFTLLDHWNWKGPNTYVPTNLKKCAVSLSATEDADFTFSTPVNNGQSTIHVNRGNNSVVLIDDVDQAILHGVSIHSTGASYVNINIIGTTSAAETAVLPKHLLGTKYMVQGAPGLLVDNLPVYSQFTVVGTEDGSSISVKPRVAMTCVTTGANVPAGQVTTFPINEKQVLLFQPVNYEDEISGAVVESDHKIAVFQGNNITRIPVTANWSDFVYEQARPISSWGKEFIIPKASGLMTCDWKIIAAEDNTEVYIYSNGSKVKQGVKNAGEWFTKTIYSASSDLQVDHIVTSKPVCCYLYMTGSSANNDKGDPEMIEIVPVDKMATEARWGKAQTNDNTPHTISLLVTAPLADETKVQFNSQSLSSYATQSGVQRVEKDGFVVYQIPFTAKIGALHSYGGGFSAHIIHYAKTAEGTGYNVSLPEEMPEPTELCIDGTLLFREDFGGNDVNDPRVSQTPVTGMSYTQAKTDLFGSMSSGKYIVTKSGYCNGDTTGWTLPETSKSTYRSQWYIQDDHTYPGDFSRGYFMEIDGNGGNQQFYETEINGLCEGIELTFSAYVANVFTWFQYDWYTKNRGEVIAPCLKFVLTDPTTNTVLASKETGSIPFDEDLPALTDWQYSSKWHLVGMNFTVPVGVEAIRLSIYNNVTNGNGNDFAIDDIEIRLCQTPNTVTTDTTVCDTVSKILWRGRMYEPAEILRDTLPGSCGFDSIYYILYVQTKHCEEPVQADLCTEGILLFREDFGGNDPGDPDVSTSPVPGISSSYYYQQIFQLYPAAIGGQDMKDGCFLVAKKGFHQSTLINYSNWHIMDDHTYPNNDMRGYFLEVNGLNSGTSTIYTTTIDVRESEQLSFSAYVANVTTAGQYAAWNDPDYSFPKLMFIIMDPQTDQILARYTTDTIGHDWNNYPKSWDLSAEWQLVGMNFTVPAGVTKLIFTIHNIATGSLYSNRGNDFALDDIEIRLCRTAEVYTTDTTVCDTVSRILWRGRSYEPAEVLRDTFPSVYGYDSIYYILNVKTESCGQVDPPTPPEPELYPLIVNKYNWVLLLDNVTFAQLFPGRSIRRLQWYRNNEPIPGANEDDYSEHDELNGRYQLRLDLDNGQAIRSNILEIHAETAAQPIHVYIYDSRGVPVGAEHVTHGIYLYRYEQGGQVWTEKKFIP